MPPTTTPTIPANFDWPYALRLLAQGRRVRRAAWLHGEYLFIGQPNCVKAPEAVLVALHNDGISGAATMHATLWLRGADKWLVAGYMPRADETFAVDWQVVAEPGAVAP